MDGAITIGFWDWVMAKSVLLSPVLYPVYQNTALRAEKLPTLDRQIPSTEKFCL
jgi:hypothetical protein